MGRRARRKPDRLAEKLREIRLKLRLSQNEMISRMGLKDELTREEISAFERNTHEPNLIILLAYSEAANIFLEVLVRDDLDLPEEFTSTSKHLGVPHKTKSKKNLRHSR